MINIIEGIKQDPVSSFYITIGVLKFLASVPAGFFSGAIVFMIGDSFLRSRYVR